MQFVLRPWNSNDLESLVRYANNEKIAANLMDRFPHPYTEDHGRIFLQLTTQALPPNVLAIEIQGEACGGIGLHLQEDIFRRNAELGYWLAEPFWGKGIITKAIGQMVPYGFRNWDIDRIFARPFGTNLASQKALEKAGFVQEGRFEKTIYKNGRYFDEVVYAIRR
jgi:[ribosomal protein S5]-alanine N-acetyltransferase